MAYSDLEQAYVNKGYVLKFLHVPTGQNVSFKGLITALSDKFDSDWNDEQVYGRSDPISTFRGTKRTITVTWDVVAADANEAKENMRKVSLMMAMLYPVYNGEGASNISTSPIFRISFGNLIHSVSTSKGGDNSGIVGKVSGFDFTPNMVEQFFDVSTNILYPQSLTMTCAITVFHIHPLGWKHGGAPRNKLFPYGENIDKGDRDGTRNIKETKIGKGTSLQEKAKQQQILGGKK